MSRHLAAILLALPAVAQAQPAAPEPPAEPPETPPPAAPPPEPAASPTPATPPRPADPQAACKQRRHDLVLRAEAIPDFDERGHYLASIPACPTAEEADETAIPTAGSVAAPAYHATGLLLSLQLELTPTPVSSFAYVDLPSTHVLVGYQLASVAVGLTLDVARSSASFAAAPGISYTTAMVGPSLAATLAHSETGRTELLGVVAAGYRVYDGFGGSLDHRLTVRVGPSLRCWLSPSFAIAATSGLRIDSLANTGGTSHETVVISHALDLMGVF
jgi:hypothetical protein